MWTAIKSDLFDFVNTIQSDTQKVVEKVMGDDDEDIEEQTIIQRKLTDLKRSFETYGTVWKPNFLLFLIPHLWFLFLFLF